MRAHGVLAANVDVALVRSHGERGDDDPLDELVRILLEDNPIFEAARLGFVRVAEEVNGFAQLEGYEAPFHSRRESSASPPFELALFHLFDDGVGRHPQSFF